MINENDTVATQEIRYGDNDRLAARVGTMASADCVILLSDIDGLFTAPPAKDPDAEFVPLVPRITAEIEAMAGGAASELSRGGMMTKIEAGKIATSGGRHAHCQWHAASPDPRGARGRALHVVFVALHARHGSQTLDRRNAGAARHLDDR